MRIKKEKRWCTSYVNPRWVAENTYPKIKRIRNGRKENSRFLESYFLRKILRFEEFETLMQKQLETPHNQKKMGK